MADAKLIQSIVEEYENMASLPQDQKRDKQWPLVKKIHEKITKMVKSHLTDIKVLVATLRKSCNGKTPAQLVLEFLHHMINEFHHVLFVPSSSGELFMDPADKDIVAVYKNFLYWIFKSLLQLLLVEEAAILFPYVQNTLKSLLGRVKTKNQQFYALLLEEIYKTVKCLNIEYLRLNNTGLSFPFIIESFCIEDVLDSQNTLEHRNGISIESERTLDLFSLNFSALLQPFCGDISLLDEDSGLEIWKLCFTHLEFSAIELKSESYKLLNVLLQTCGLPSSVKIYHGYMYSLSASFEAKISCLCNNDEVTENDKKYFRNITEHYNQIFKCIYCFKNFSKTSVETSVFVNHPMPFEYIKAFLFILKSEVDSIQHQFESTHLENNSNDFVKEIFKDVVLVCSYLFTNLQQHVHLTNYGSIYKSGISDLFSFLMKHIIDEYMDHNEEIYKAIFQALKWEILSKTRHTDTDTQPFIIVSNLKLNYQFCLEVQKMYGVLLNLMKVDGNNIVLSSMDADFLKFSTLLNILNLLVYFSNPCMGDDCYKETLVKIATRLYNRDALQKILKMGFKMLVVTLKNKHNSSPLTKLIEMYEKCVNLFKPVLTGFWLLRNITTDLAPIENDIIPALIMLYSLPWLSTGVNEASNVFNSVKWLPKSVVMPIADELSKAGLNYGQSDISDGKIPFDILKTCIYALSLMPNKFALRWRCTIVIKWVLGQGSFEIKHEACLPMSIITSNVDKSHPPHFEILKSELKSLCDEIKSGEDSLKLAFTQTVLFGAIVNVYTGFKDYHCNLLPKMCFKDKLCEHCATFLPCVFNNFVLLLPLNMFEQCNILSKPDTDYLCNNAMLLHQKLNLSTNECPKDCQNNIWDIFLFSLSRILLSCKKTSIDSGVENVLKVWLTELQRLTLSETGNEEFLCPVLRGIFVLQDQNSAWNSMIMNTISELIWDAKDKQDLELQRHFTIICGFIANISLSDNPFSSTIKLFDWSIEKLCLDMSSSSILIQSGAFIQLENLGTQDKDKGWSWNDIFQIHRKALCSSLSKVLITNAESPKRPALEILEDFAQLCNTTVDLFLLPNLPFIVPPMITSDKNVVLLELVTLVTGKPGPDILMEYFKQIFCYAVVNESSFTTLFTFLEKATGIKKKSLLLLKFGQLVYYLVSFITVNYDAVFSKLRMILTIQSNSSIGLASKASISEVLKPHFLGFLTFINGQLRSKSLIASEKTRALESFIKVIQLIDQSEITAVRIKIINTLSLAQNSFTQKEWKSICCRAWNKFLRCVEPGCLASILSQVSVTILPLFQDFPQEVSKILNFLVIENISHTKPSLHELYFLPQHATLKTVLDTINKEIKRKNLHEDTLISQLKQSLNLTNHESTEIRVQALTKLRQTLIENQRSLQEHIAETAAIGVTEPTLSQLVVSLLTSCRDPNKSVKLLAGKCLGLLGAIDPDRFVINLPQENLKSKTYFQLDDIDFAFDLISEVVKAFLASKPAYQDITAYTLQELIKIYECKEGKKDCIGRRIWRMFPENVQEVLEPHQSTRYKLKDQVVPNLQQSILTKRPNMTFRQWVGGFCEALMHMVYETNNSSTAGKVFHSCSVLVHNDVNVALFLLPHALLHALIKSNYADFIQQEILSVLKLSQKSETHSKESTQSTATTPSWQSVKPTQPGENSFLQLPTLASQAVFTAIDHAVHFIRVSDAANNSPQAKYSIARLRDGDALEKVKVFLEVIPQLELSQTAFACRSHTRALMHYETHLCNLRSQSRSSNNDNVIVLDEESQSSTPSDEMDINFLQQLFVEMDEPDGVAGIAAVTSGKPTLSLQIKHLESRGMLQDAMACYERLIDIEPHNLECVKGYMKCYIDLGLLKTAISFANQSVSQKPQWKHDLKPYCVDAALRLGQWDAIENSLADLCGDAEQDWNIKLGNLLLVTKKQDWEKSKDLLDNLYLDQTGPLSAASMEQGSYQRGYEHILRLHMLSEVESMISMCQSPDHSTATTVIESVDQWHLRTQSLQMSFRAREPIFSLRRIMSQIIRELQPDNKTNTTGNVIGKLWLQSAKCARKAGYVQTAYSSLINAQGYDLPEFCIEYAKWLWKKDESHEALLTLQHGVSEHFQCSSSNTKMNANSRLTRAKAMLLVGRLMEESSSFDSSKVIQQFKDVTTFMNEWEDAHFFRGKYYDKIMNPTNRNDAITMGNFNVLYHIMNNYGQSLRYGTSHIYESLTKLLTIWFDFGAKVVTSGTNAKQNREMYDDYARMIAVISDLRQRLPAYVFLVGFSQLVSRICHQHIPTFNELKEVLVKVIIAYPQQALWSLMAISKSSYPERAQRCKVIFNHAEKQDGRLAKVFSDATRLTDRLLELCNKPAQNVSKFNVGIHFKSLKRLVEDASFTEILMPLQRLMTVTLPLARHSTSDRVSASANSTQGRLLNHNPFHEVPAYIVGFEDLVEILPSLQRPKKVSIKGSDGKSYLFLCKPKDDLRKDARLMEFNTIVNKCLNKDAESRKRQLKIRTYAVVPLNEECGLIEWVPNTHGLRHILLKIYKAMNIYCSGKELKSYMLPNNAPVSRKLSVFKEKLLPRHPPVFRQWFLSTFPNPTQWYNARLAYSRSTAVMSMVGYILGLGDRHGENILFDSTNGDAVHVDFNCLFNKGLSLEVPEIVPFRLTHNMVDAMGPVKYEGFFRIACETVMKILREQREPLLSVLKTFIYDPLVEWSKKKSGRSNGHSEGGGEIVNERAKSHINEIDKRLRGITTTKNKGLPLSIQGHVHFLIQEATDDEKLSQMYIGWAAFM